MNAMRYSLLRRVTTISDMKSIESNISVNNWAQLQSLVVSNWSTIADLNTSMSLVPKYRRKQSENWGSLIWYQNIPSSKTPWMSSFGEITVTWCTCRYRSTKTLIFWIRHTGPIIIKWCICSSIKVKSISETSSKKTLWNSRTSKSRGPLSRYKSTERL